MKWFDSFIITVSRYHCGWSQTTLHPRKNGASILEKRKFPESSEFGDDRILLTKSPWFRIFFGFINRILFFLKQGFKMKLAANNRTILFNDDCIHEMEKKQTKTTNRSQQTKWGKKTRALPWARWPTAFHHLPLFAFQMPTSFIHSFMHRSAEGRYSRAGL